MQFQAHNTKLKATLHFRIMFVIIGFFESFYSCNYCKSLSPPLPSLSLSLSLTHPNTIGGGVSHCGLAIYILKKKKYLKAKEELWKFIHLFHHAKI